MGGSGGGSYGDWKTSSLTNVIRKDADKSAADYEWKLAGLFGELLASFNDRPVNVIEERLHECRDLLGDAVEATLEQLFGGSVAKHTFVDGLSDIDALLIINGSSFEDHAPARILEQMHDVLAPELKGRAEVTYGQLAVSIKYSDQMEIQLLPAIQMESGLKIPSANNDGWASINPETFRDVLTKRNEECGRRLIPTIKLAKAVIANLPEDYRLTGYHVESLAISAFRGYEGKKTTAAMLPLLFEKARELVLTPIRDSTGQSVHVDDYLGEANSVERRNVSHLLNRVFKRMRNASAAGADSQWRDLFFSQD
jgi:hypothetical protein